MAARKPRLPGDAKITELVRGIQQRDANTKRLSPEAMQERMRRTLSVPNPNDNSARLAEDRECQIQLRVTDIDPYDRNPRRNRNHLYAEIKESIRVAKVISPLTVTKRPGSSRYMVGAGGNTRLKAQRELWDETGESRFEYLLVTYRPWVSEAQVLTAHLVENELHAGMSFWDKALGVCALKQELEGERDKALSLRQWHEAMKQNGLALSVTMLSFYAFAVANLADLGPATRLLSTNAVRDLQPVFAYLSNYVVAHGGTEEDWQAIRRQVLQTHAAPLPSDDDLDEAELAPKQTLDTSDLIDRLDRAVAGLLDQDPAQVRDVRQLLKTVPGASLDDLVARTQAQNTAAPEPTSVPTMPSPSASAKLRGAQTVGLSGAVDPATPSRTPAGPKTTTPCTEAAGLALSQPHPKGKAPPSAAVSALDEVQGAVTEFAEACGIKDLLRLCSDMPSGYYVEIPADGAPIDGGDRALRYGAWWIAAMHSGQIDGSYSERMPEDSLWRQAQRMEAGQDATALQWLIETVLGSPIGLVELGLWLTHCPTQVLDHYRALILAVRRLRSEAPDRFMLDGGGE